MRTKCARCGETRKTLKMWEAMVCVPNADVVCCLMPKEALR